MVGQQGKRAAGNCHVADTFVITPLTGTVKNPIRVFPPGLVTEPGSRVSLVSPVASWRRRGVLGFDGIVPIYSAGVRYDLWGLEAGVRATADSEVR